MLSLYIDSQTDGYATLGSFRDGYEIKSLFVPLYDRGLGGGSRVLDSVCGAADRENVKLYLIVVPDGDSPLQRQQLEGFYRKRGFVATAGKYDWYKREPTLWASVAYGAPLLAHAS